MHVPPVLLVLAAGIVTLASGEALTPTAQAQAKAALVCRVSVRGLHIARTPGGTEVTGQMVNTGPNPLTYTSVTVVFTSTTGREVGRGAGYLIAGPLMPGQAAGFRAIAASVPPGSRAVLLLREAGQPVTVVTGN